MISCIKHNITRNLSLSPSCVLNNKRSNKMQALGSWQKIQLDLLSVSSNNTNLFFPQHFQFKLYSNMEDKVRFSKAKISTGLDTVGGPKCSFGKWTYPDAGWWSHYLEISGL